MMQVNQFRQSNTSFGKAGDLFIWGDGKARRVEAGMTVTPEGNGNLRIKTPDIVAPIKEVRVTEEVADGDDKLILGQTTHVKNNLLQGKSVEGYENASLGQSFRVMA